MFAQGPLYPEQLALAVCARVGRQKFRCVMQQTNTGTNFIFTTYKILVKRKHPLQRYNSGEPSAKKSLVMTADCPDTAEESNDGGDRNHRSIGKKDCLPPEAADTADLFLFMDMLFDSVNGSSVRPKKGKLLRCAVTKTSPHVDFWHEAIQVLRTFNFVDKNGKNNRPPSVKNWERTLCGWKIIWSMLQKEGFKYFSLQSINQDPLENFFGCIRSHGIRNIMPSCSSFMSSFKTLLVNKFTSPHSLGSNCIKHDTQGSLDTLRVFLTDSLKQGEYNSDAAHDLDLCHIAFIDKDDDPQCLGTDENPLSTSTKVYISGYIARKVMKPVGDCLEC
ncbi:uncharacterized protein LOC134527710 isoform X2 [Bacillus rossius redtenbacheri]|uniref:uncharacterized protein LOC134527710 isoform X2 n=1 Tax=Bacillus rossius redtenbacheri TaxID=93214 RepID=UPI002FDEB849